MNEKVRVWSIKKNKEYLTGLKDISVTFSGLLDTNAQYAIRRHTRLWSQIQSAEADGFAVGYIAMSPATLRVFAEAGIGGMGPSRLFGYRTAVIPGLPDDEFFLLPAR